MRDTWFTALPHDNLEDIHVIRKLFMSRDIKSSEPNPYLPMVVFSFEGSEKLVRPTQRPLTGK